jgi:hypothetical protein
MSNEGKGKKRRHTPIQHISRNNESFFVINPRTTDEIIFNAVKMGTPSTSKDKTLTIANICYVKAGRRIKRLLVNDKGRFRIPSDSELRKIYTDCKKKEDATITIKGAKIKIYDPRWATLKNKSKKRKTAPNTDENRLKALEEKVGALVEKLN